MWRFAGATNSGSALVCGASRAFAATGSSLQRQYTPAAEAFERAIAMAREVGIDAPYEEVSRALALVRLGQPEAALTVTAAEDVVARCLPWRLAELYLLLGDRAKARENALAGYRKAWADGPPYSFHWDLEACRKVLGALGEPEPVLPPFDPARTEPLPFEADVRSMIAELEAEAREKRERFE